MGFRLALAVFVALATGAGGLHAAGLGQTGLGQISWADDLSDSGQSAYAEGNFAQAFDDTLTPGGPNGDFDTLSRFGTRSGLLGLGARDTSYLALLDGEEFDASIALADNLQVRFGETALYPRGYGASEFSYLGQADNLLGDARLARSNLVGVDWGFASWGSIGLTASQTSEPSGLLASFSPAQTSVAKSANVSSVGVAAHLGFGSGWVTTFSYNQGIALIPLKSDAIIGASDTLHNRAYSFGVSKYGLFDDDDSLGLAVTRPLQLYTGATVAADGGNAGDLRIDHEYLPLTGNTSETDLEVGYVTTFMDGALALQANAGYQMNVAGLGGSNAVSVISRAKINF